MPEEPDEKRQPNLELPQLRLPGFRRKGARRTGPAGPPEQLGGGRQPVVGPEETGHVAVTEEQAADQPTEAQPEPPSPGTQPEPAQPATHRDRRPRTAPALPGPVAAPLTGLVVGALGAGVTYGGLRGCEAVNGTPSCGGPGLGYLVAIAIGMVAVGALLLKALRAAEPVGTSFLAVGIIAVVVLLGLTGVIFSVWMFLAIPAVAAASYALAHWVTTRFVDVEQPPGPDVR